MYSKTFKYPSAKTTFGMLLLIISCFLIVGCSQKGTAEEPKTAKAEDSAEKNTEAIQTVIEKEFNGPDKKYRELWDAAVAAQHPDMNQEEYDAFTKSPIYKEFTAYVESVYAPYFTENGYDFFINTAPAFMYSSFEGDYKLNTSEITINQNENEPTLYDFTFKVTYENENKEKEHYRFEGKAIVPKEGKIGKIEFIDKDGLQQKMNEDSYN